MIEQEHIIKILEEAKEAIKKEDTIKLKDLSNQTIHSASIHQDIDCIMVAVIIYSISKILERTGYKKYSSWNGFIASYTAHIGRAASALKNNDYEKFRRELEKI